MSYENFDFKSFLKDSREVLVNPKNYFTNINIKGGFTEPLIKTVIYGVIAGIFKLLWSVLNIGLVVGGLWGGAIGIMAFIWSIIGSVIVLFIGAILILIISSICEGNTDFEACLRISAAMMILMPINAFLGFTFGLNIVLGMSASLLLFLFGLYVLYIALIVSLKTKPKATRIVSYILIALIVVSLMVITIKIYSANRYFRDLDPQAQVLKIPAGCLHFTDYRLTFTDF